MTALLVLTLLFIALGVASALGLTVDSRDTDYGLGAVLNRPRPPAGR